MRHQSGFTLVEIAIVLVIIGLLLGGVLKGQELITQAKIKNVAKDFESVTVAIYAYQDRYKRIPGDDPGAGRWSVEGAALSPPASTNNSVIDGGATAGYASTTNTDENRLFWAELRLAGFISGPTDTLPNAVAQPTNAAGGILGVQNNGLGLQGTVICSGSLPAKIAAAIDAQFDDGNGLTGTVRGILDPVPPTAVPAALPGTAQTYNETGNALYVVCRTL